MLDVVETTLKTLDSLSLKTTKVGANEIGRPLQQQQHINKASVSVCVFVCKAFGEEAKKIG
jgi:hypothetical protein